MTQETFEIMDPRCRNPDKSFTIDCGHGSRIDYLLQIFYRSYLVRRSKSQVTLFKCWKLCRCFSCV